MNLDRNATENNFARSTARPATVISDLDAIDSHPLFGCQESSILWISAAALREILIEFVKSYGRMSYLCGVAVFLAGNLNSRCREVTVCQHANEAGDACDV